MVCSRKDVANGLVFDGFLMVFNVICLMAFDWLAGFIVCTGLVFDGF